MFLEIFDAHVLDVLKTSIYNNGFVYKLMERSNNDSLKINQPLFNMFVHLKFRLLNLLAQFMDVSVIILQNIHWSWLNLCKALGMVIRRIVEVWINHCLMQMIINIIIIFPFGNFLLKIKNHILLNWKKKTHTHVTL